jgi:hypothetical protein
MHVHQVNRASRPCLQELTDYSRLIATGCGHECTATFTIGAVDANP